MICERYRPAKGGVEKHVEKLVNELVQEGFKIDVLTSRHTHDLRSVERMDKHLIFRFPWRWDKNPFLSSLWVIKNRHRFRKYNIIHVHDTIPLLFWSLPFFVLKQRKQIFATFHGFERDPIPPIFKILRKIARLIVYRVLCIGKFIERDYNVACDSCSIGAVDIVPSSIQTRSGFVFIGRLEQDTGILHSMEVLQELEENYGIRSHMTICGSGSQERLLREISVRKGIDVQFRGWVENVHQYLEQGFVCLAGGLLSILESLAEGVPVIAYANTKLKRSYYQSVIDAGGNISIQSDIKGIAKEFARLSHDPDLYKRISMEGIKFASTMTWSGLASKYRSLWRVH
ncbi:MAG: glycosyltransferase family 4 protein [Candidatus Thorarchaeota archaeon]